MTNHSETFPDLSPREAERLDRTLALLPNDVSNGLEIGFYDFRVSRRLLETMDLVSIDLPRPIQAHKEFKLAFADVQQLPFRDGAFDIVICTEVLEHLPDSVLFRGIRELQRVSRKYVLVSVPYRQRVWNELFKCTNCGYVGHSMGHLRYIDEQDFPAMFDVATVETVQFIGRCDGYAPDWLYAIGNRLGNTWQDYCFGQCPRCGKADTTVAPNPLGFVLQRITWRVQRAVKSRPAWMLLLFKVASTSVD